MKFIERNNRTIGTVSGILASIAMAVMTLLVHKSVERYTLGDIVLSRSVFMIMFSLPFAFKALKQVFSSQHKTLWLRSILGGLAMVMYLKTLQLGHVGLANSLAVLTQVVVPIGAWIYLRERLSRKQCVGISVIIVSVLYLQSGVIGRPAIELVSLGLGSAVLAAISFVMLRTIAGLYSTSTIVFLIAMVTAVLSPVFEISLKPVDFSSPLLWGIGISALAMQLFMTISYRHLFAAEALVINESFIVVAGILNVILGFSPFIANEFFAYTFILVGVFISQKKTPFVDILIRSFKRG
jgi:drug/metabolite transporter (DMT)-like permease